MVRMVLRRVVASILFLVVFGLLEMSRLYVIRGTVTTAILQGGSEASIRTSDSETIRQEIEKTLSIAGIRQFNPADRTELYCLIE